MPNPNLEWERYLESLREQGLLQSETDKQIFTLAMSAHNQEAAQRALDAVLADRARRAVIEKGSVEELLKLASEEMSRTSRV